MEPMETEKPASGALQLWGLARVLMEQGLAQQAAQCLEVRCQRSPDAIWR